jgi:antitoxin FitA
MASITIHNLDDGTTNELRLRATKHGRSMEDEARDILRAVPAVEPRPPKNLYDSIRRRIEPLGGVDLNIRRGNN